MVCSAVSDLREVNLVKFFVYYCLKSSTNLISVQCSVQFRKVVFLKFAEAHVFNLPAFCL